MNETTPEEMDSFPLEETSPLVKHGNIAVENGKMTRFQKFKSYFSQGSVVGSAFNLANSTIGTGILFLPYVVYKTGVVLGLIFIMIGGILGFFTVYLLHKSYEKMKSTHSEVTDYEQVGYYTYGRWLSFFIQFCVFVLNFGSVLSLTIVVGHILSGWISNNVIWALVLLVVMLPSVAATCSGKIKNLQILSVAAMASIYLFIFFVLLSFFMGWTESSKEGNVVYVPDFSLSDTWMNIFSYLGVVSFSYSCHMGEVQEKNLHKVPISIALAVLFDYAVYSMVGAYGYLSFCDNTQTDIVLSFEGEMLVDNILRILLAISVLATFPMSGYPCRYALNNAIIDVIELILKKKIEEKKKKILDWVLILVTTLVVVLGASYLIALVYPFASVIFGLVGSTVSVFLSYIFPCLFYLKLYKPKWYSIQAFGVVFVLIFGVVFGFGVTTYQLIRLIMYGE